MHMDANLQSRVKIDRELFYRLKAISAYKGKDVSDCIKEWIDAEEEKKKGATI
jgi:hypothetical protein